MEHQKNKSQENAQRRWVPLRTLHGVLAPKIRRYKHTFPVNTLAENLGTDTKRGEKKQNKPPIAWCIDRHLHIPTGGKASLEAETR